MDSIEWQELETDRLLNKIKREIDLILRDANGIEGAINWADLRCVQVMKWVDQDINEGITALIEEAAPDNLELMNHILEELQSRGITGVEIEFNW